jgi:hypothetical protein
MSRATALDNASDFYVPGLMDLSGYALEPARLDHAWNAFVEASAEGSVFCRAEFLDAIDGRSAAWYVLKNGTPKAAVTVIEDDDGRSCRRHDLVIYNGILMAPAAPRQNRAQEHSERFRVCCFVARELTRMYHRVAFSAAPPLADLRPFLWHNYGSDGPKFHADVRYTSLLGLDPPDWDGGIETSRVYAGANKSRRQEIRYGLDQDVTTRQAFEPDLFVRLYRQTFERQDLTVPEAALAELERVVRRLHDAGLGRMFVSHDGAGDAGSVAVFAVDEKRAYYLYGANDAALRAGRTGTMVLWHAFGRLAGDGVAEVDLEGVNSPKRGYFKLSFGGSVTPYYHLTYAAGA